MEYDDLLRDFAQRTKANLLAIQRARNDGGDVYETTQLINSLLGMVVLPSERFANDIPCTELRELVKQGWPVPEVSGEFPAPDNLRQLMRYLRNAVAHFNVKFQVDHQGHISGLLVWNVDLETKKKNWKATLSISQLELLVMRFAELIAQTRPSHQRRGRSRPPSRLTSQTAPRASNRPIAGTPKSR